jgi:Fe-S-cluster containining protein
LLWQLSHENIKAFRDHTGWHLIIYNMCSFVDRKGECSIYDNRPITCREHSAENCEYNSPISDSSLQYFGSFQSLDEYCNKRFKTWRKRF